MKYEAHIEPQADKKGQETCRFLSFLIIFIPLRISFFASFYSLSGAAAALELAAAVHLFLAVFELSKSLLNLRLLL
jgi:hypothetical protein